MELKNPLALCIYMYIQYACTIDPSRDFDIDSKDFKTYIIQFSAIVSIIILLSVKKTIALYALHLNKILQHTSILLGQ